jgi:hypothetical protein
MIMSKDATTKDGKDIPKDTTSSKNLPKRKADSVPNNIPKNKDKIKDVSPSFKETGKVSFIISFAVL